MCARRRGGRTWREGVPQQEDVAAQIKAGELGQLERGHRWRGQQRQRQRQEQPAPAHVPHACRRHVCVHVSSLALVSGRVIF